MICKVVEFSIVCDICETDGSYCDAWVWQEETHRNFHRYPLQGYDKKRDLLNAAKKEGWQVRPKQICPTCLKEMKP